MGLAGRKSGSHETPRWRKADSNSWSHFGARATLSLFATSRFEWDLCATYRSEPILPPDPAECARRVVVVTVLRGPHRNLPGYAITGLFEMDEAGVGRMRSDVVSGAEGAADVQRPHRRAAHDPKAATIAVNGRNGGYLTFAVTLADGVVAP